MRKYKTFIQRAFICLEKATYLLSDKYNYSSHYTNGDEYDSKQNSIYLTITPGVAYSLTHSIQLEAGLQNLLSIGYSFAEENAKTAGDEDYKINNFNASTSLNSFSLNSIFVGLRFFNKK